MSNKTGVIGLGAMGSGMARNLSAYGLLSAVWNRSPAKAADLAAAVGLAPSEDLLQLAAVCDTLVLSVSADEDVLEVVDALFPAMTADHLVIDTSTIRRETAVEAARRLQAVGAGFIDAPVSGGAEGARNGTLAVMVGGEQAHFERAAPVFEAIGSRAELMGPVGSGQATKAVNQLMVAGINQAVTEALAFAEALQLPMEKVIDLISGGAAGNWFLSHRGPTMVRGEYDPGFRVALHQKDLGICREMAAQLNVDLPMVEMTRDHYRQLIKEGFGDEDISALMRVKRELFS